MTNPNTLGHLSGLQAMMEDLLGGVEEAQGDARFDEGLHCLSWYFGRSVYRELYWLRVVFEGDADLSGRVRHPTALVRRAALARTC